MIGLDDKLTSRLGRFFHIAQFPSDNPIVYSLLIYDVNYSMLIGGSVMSPDNRK